MGTQMAPRRPQRPPSDTKDSTKTPQEAPKIAQEAPKVRPGSPKSSPRDPKEPPRGPKDPQEVPRRLPRAPKRCPRGPKDLPRDPQEAPKTDIDAMSNPSHLLQTHAGIWRTMIVHCMSFCTWRQGGRQSARHSCSAGVEVPPATQACQLKCKGSVE